MLNKTKIVATIGPATVEKEQIKKLMKNGMDVARINMSHADYIFATDIINKINELNHELGLSVAVMIDLMGPEVRTGKFVNGQAYFRKGDKIRIYMDPIMGDNTKFSVNYPNLINDVKYNDIIRIKDGMMIFEVVDLREDSIICEVLTDGFLEDKQTVSVKGTKLNIPYLSQKDKDDILFSHKMNIDFIALSYVGSADEVLTVNDMLIDLKNDHIGIISKIENEQGIDNLEEIVRVSDGVMVARGDLGVEIPLERVPGVQKKIISKCHDAGIVSIVATELLSSMETNYRPTRAEVSDVANAVLDGADAVMLSGETTVGNYPIETLNMMEKIITSAEQDLDYGSFMERTINTEKQDITGMIAHSVADCANRLKCCAIIAPTMSGYTARKMSRFRPSCPIIAVSPNVDAVKSLQLHFAVNPVLIDELNSFDKITTVAKQVTKELINPYPGDKIIITGGYPFKDIKNTNFMKIEEI